MIRGDGHQRQIQLAETGVRNDSNVACERTFDRIARLKAEEQMQPKHPVDTGAADRAAKRMADKLARECQDAIDIENKTLIIAPNGFRVRKNIISGRWEHEVLYE